MGMVLRTIRVGWVVREVEAEDLPYGSTPEAEASTAMIWCRHASTWNPRLRGDLMVRAGSSLRVLKDGALVSMSVRHAFKRTFARGKQRGDSSVDGATQGTIA